MNNIDTLLVLSGLAAAFVGLQLATGWTVSRSGLKSRRDDPNSYWLGIFMYALVFGAGLLTAALCMVLPSTK
jgi:hypothetical protein